MCSNEKLSTFVEEPKVSIPNHHKLKLLYCEIFHSFHMVNCEDELKLESWSNLFQQGEKILC